MIETLTYELSVLAKAVQHKNLSAAAVHVGLSQPQLSRLISKIENVLNIMLLDRSARRKSGWTPLANDLAMTFSKGIGRLEADLVSLTQDREVTELRIGTLEGLSLIASQFVKSCFDQLKIKVVHLDVLDFKDLDAQFLSGDLDLIFTVRSPSKQKFTHFVEVGYQQMEKMTTDPGTMVVSPYELAGKNIDQKESQKYFVSNSLSLREYWLREIGGTGTLPVGAKKGRGKGFYTVYLIGTEILSPQLWQKISGIL